MFKKILLIAVLLCSSVGIVQAQEVVDISNVGQGSISDDLRQAINSMRDKIDELNATIREQKQEIEILKSEAHNNLCPN